MNNFCSSSRISAGKCRGSSPVSSTTFDQAVWEFSPPDQVIDDSFDDSFDDSGNRSLVRGVCVALRTEQTADRIERVALNGLDHLDIGAGGHRDGTVPQDPLNGGGLNTHREEQRGARVAEVMDAQLRQFRLRAYIVKHAIRIARFDKPAKCGS